MDDIRVSSLDGRVHILGMWGRFCVREEEDAIEWQNPPGHGYTG